MSTSSQKLIAIVFMINLMTGFGLTFYNTGLYDETFITTDKAILDEHSSNLYTSDPYSATKNKDYLTETSPGNILELGIVVFKVLINGLNPFSITLDMFEDDLLKLLALAIMLFRTVMGLFIALELYNILKNRKAT